MYSIRPCCRLSLPGTTREISSSFEEKASTVFRPQTFKVVVLSEISQEYFPILNSLDQLSGALPGSTL